VYTFAAFTTLHFTSYSCYGENRKLKQPSIGLVLENSYVLQVYMIYKLHNFPETRIKSKNSLIPHLEWKRRGVGFTVKKQEKGISAEKKHIY
jgi:hypothetical protein